MKNNKELKAIILKHTNNRSYIMDSGGFFHYVKGYKDLPVGTEIIIRETKRSSITWINQIAAVFAVIMLSGAIMLSTSYMNFAREQTQNTTGIYSTLEVIENNGGDFVEIEENPIPLASGENNTGKNTSILVYACICWAGAFISIGAIIWLSVVDRIRNRQYLEFKKRKK